MKNFVLTAVVVLALAVGAQAAVIQNSDSVGSESSSGQAITGFSTDTDLLIVGIGGMMNSLTDLVEDVTFDGTSLTPVTDSFINDGGGWGQFAEFYYMTNPTGQGDVVWESSARCYGSVVAYAIDDVTIEDVVVATSAKADGLAGGAFSTSIETTAPSLLIDFLALDDPDAVTATSGQEIVMDTKTGDKLQVSSVMDVEAGTHTMGYTLEGDDDPGWAAHSVVAIVPEPATMSLLAIGGLGALLRRRRR
ncbi:MAG: PEP-CTERM sorting domain-containing protein [Phycisphaerae bacterium]